MPVDTNISMIFKAFHFAALKHNGQLRKGGKGTPYINHLIHVSDLLWNTGNIRDTTIIIASILHDTIEDTDTTPEELMVLFGPHIADIVQELTDDRTLPNNERRRKQVEHASSLTYEACLIKIADKISNISDILESPPIDWTLNQRIDYVKWGKSVIDNLRSNNKELNSTFDTLYQTAMEQLSKEA